jgi:ribonuclease P/MRP protein subunit POP5
MNALWNAITELYGEHGASQTGLILIEYDPGEKLAVIRTNNAVLNMTRASIATITKIEEKPVAIHVLAISGTIKALHKNLRQ